MSDTSPPPPLSWAKFPSLAKQAHLMLSLQALRKQLATKGILARDAVGLAYGPFKYVYSLARLCAYMEPDDSLNFFEEVSVCCVSVSVHFTMHIFLSMFDSTKIRRETSQELRMLSSVTLNCQITKIVMNSCSQLSELQSVSQMSQIPRIVVKTVKISKNQ